MRSGRDLPGGRQVKAESGPHPALASVALAAWLAAPISLSAEVNRYLVDTGPLRVRDQFLLGIGSLAFDPVAADVLEKGVWQLDLVLTVSNDFAHSQVVEDVLEERTQREALTLEQLRAIDADDPGSGIFQIDGEHYRAAIAVRRGIGKGVHLEAVVPVISFQGGGLDSVIEGFHDTFSLPQAGRLGVPKDSFLTYVRSEGQELFVDDDPGFALGDIVLGAKFNLLKEPESKPVRLAVEALLKLPTGDEEAFASSGSTDVGAQILATKYYTKSCLHGSVGLLYLGEIERLGVSEQVVISGMVAYERSLGAKTSGLIQVTLSQSPFDELDLEELAVVSSQVTLGFKRVIRESVLFVGLTENVAKFDNSPDIGFHLGLTRSFQ
jgi:hypothetical protein